MTNVKGATANETKLIKGIQKAVGANQDGVIGPQTLSDLACILRSITEPLTLNIYGMPVIIARDILPIARPGKGLGAIPNSISGSFYGRFKDDNGKEYTAPVSICVRDDMLAKDCQTLSCHYWEGYPESVLYRVADGSFGIKRVKTSGELPSVKWAVGGMGLLGNYNPAAEGFTGKFSDVLRLTNHTMLGVKNGYCYLVYCRDMTGAQVNDFAKTLGLEMAVMLDGGHIAGMNGTEAFAKINTGITQYYVIQGI